MRFRKKPVVIEAWQWLFSPEQEPDPAWVRDALGRWPHAGGIAFEPEHKDGPRIRIATLDAIAVALPGDWIIRGVQGELYPIKDSIFRETYEPDIFAAPYEPAEAPAQQCTWPHEYGAEPATAEPGV